MRNGALTPCSGAVKTVGAHAAAWAGVCGLSGASGARFARGDRKVMLEVKLLENNCICIDLQLYLHTFDKNILDTIM